MFNTPWNLLKGWRIWTVKKAGNQRENEVAGEESNGADEMVTEATYCKHLNIDGEGLARKEV